LPVRQNRCGVGTTAIEPEGRQSESELAAKRRTMDRLIIRGGRRIEGSVQVCGAKNAALPQIAAALLSPEPVELANVPEVIDVNTMLALMREFGVTAERGPGRRLVLDAGGARNAQAPYDIVRRMRASILVLAPLFCTRVDAGRLRHRRPPYRPAPQGARDAWR
jgi:hypothetical protein